MMKHLNSWKLFSPSPYPLPPGEREFYLVPPSPKGVKRDSHLISPPSRGEETKIKSPSLDGRGQGRVKLILLMVCGVLLHAATAEARIYIRIDEYSAKKFPIAVADLRPIDGSYRGRLQREIPEVIRKCLDISGLFDVLSPDIFPSEDAGNIRLDNIIFSRWSLIDVQGVVKGGIREQGDKVIVELRLFDPSIKTLLVGKEYVADHTGSRTDKKFGADIAHRFTDEIVKALTGYPGVFTTQIAYVIHAKKKKNLAIMDVDGGNLRELTSGRVINISPAWSPDGRELVYTSFMKNAPDLFLINTQGGSPKRITFNGQANVSPVFSPDGKTILASSANSGDPELVLMDHQGSPIMQIAPAYGVDVNPAWSPDGSQIVFASERAGKLHLFVTDRMGTSVRRLTFVGYQNDAPVWSPTGDKIAFQSRDEGAFDIFVMNPDGSMVQRLTHGPGNNEYPSWSPDGRYLTFNSSRSGHHQVYIMRKDGSNPYQITTDGGMMPTWSYGR